MSSDPPASPLSEFPPLHPLVIRVLSLLPAPSLIFPNTAAAPHARLKDKLSCVGVVDGHDGGRLGTENARGARGWFARWGFGNGVEDFANADSSKQSLPIKDSTGLRDYFDRLLVTKAPPAPFGCPAMEGTGLLLSGMLFFTPQSTPLTLSLSLDGSRSPTTTPVSKESLESAIWTAISVWQRVAFPLWEGRLVTDSELEGDYFELEKMAEEDVVVGEAYGFSVLPAKGDIVLAAPDVPNGDPLVQVAYLDLIVSIWGYVAAPEGAAEKKPETRTLLTTLAQIVLDRNKRPMRFGISRENGGRDAVEVVRGTLGTDQDPNKGLYDEIDLDDEGEEDDLEFEDQFDEPGKGKKEEKKDAKGGKGKL